MYRSNLLKLTSLAIISAASSLSFADIKEIPAEEMTESYIKDTTVIVPKQQSENTDQSANVTITPNDGNPELVPQGEAADPNQNALKRPDLTPLSDDNLAKLQDYSIQQQNSSFDLPPLDLSQAERDKNLREILSKNGYNLSEFGVPKTGPIDYSQLNFSNLNISNGNISGSAGSNTGQFIINIPTDKANTTGIQNLTPGGEYQMQINNGNLQFIINNPHANK